MVSAPQADAESVERACAAPDSLGVPHFESKLHYVCSLLHYWLIFNSDDCQSYRPEDPEIDDLSESDASESVASTDDLPNQADSPAPAETWDWTIGRGDALTRYFHIQMLLFMHNHLKISVASSLFKSPTRRRGLPLRYDRRPH